MRRGLLANQDELAALRQKTRRQPFDTIYNLLQKRCDLILESSPITEDKWRAMWEQGSPTAAVLAARTAQGRILDLLIAHAVEPNTAFRDRAAEELHHLVGWTTWVDPSHPHLQADLCTAEAATATAVALDWLWEDLPAAERQRALQALRDRAVLPYVQAVAKPEWWYTCYHSWNAVVNGGCGLACLALADEEPRAEEGRHLAQKGLENFFDALGEEGGWDEGLGHWGYALRYVLLFGEAASRLLDDQRILHRRGMNSTGAFPVYFTPNGRFAGFSNRPSVPLYGTFYLLHKHFDAKEVLWWLDTYAFHEDVSTTGWSAAGLAMLFRRAEAGPVRNVQLEPVKVFEDVGWAAVADCWPKPGLYVSARAGDLSAHNSRRDMNSVQIQCDGEMLLRDTIERAGARPDDAFYQVQARDHNTLIVGERDHQIDAQGSIVEARAAGHFRWVACDASTACGEGVHFVRHLVLITEPDSGRGGLLVVLDEVENTAREKIELYWHTHGAIRTKPRSRSGLISGSQAALHFSLVATVKSKISTRAHEIDQNTCDNILCVSTGSVGGAVLASVFSPRKISGRVGFEKKGPDDVILRVGDSRLGFRRQKSHLHLEAIAAQA